MSIYHVLVSVVFICVEWFPPPLLSAAILVSRRADSPLGPLRECCTMRPATRMRGTIRLLHTYTRPLSSAPLARTLPRQPTAASQPPRQIRRTPANTGSSSRHTTTNAAAPTHNSNMAAAQHPDSHYDLIGPCRTVPHCDLPPLVLLALSLTLRLCFLSVSVSDRRWQWRPRVRTSCSLLRQEGRHRRGRTPRWKSVESRRAERRACARATSGDLTS
jgi:hypothetical protein